MYLQWQNSGDHLVVCFWVVNWPLYMLQTTIKPFSSLDVSLTWCSFHATTCTRPEKDTLNYSGLVPTNRLNHGSSHKPDSGAYKMKIISASSWKRRLYSPMIKRHPEAHETATCKSIGKLGTRCHTYLRELQGSGSCTSCWEPPIL